MRNEGAESGAAHEFSPDEEFALGLDRQDRLATFRDRFHLPRRPDGTPLIYFCGNSLGLQPLGAAAAVQQELDDWARLGVAGHFHGRRPWYSYHEPFREPCARLVGARPAEVVVMNGLSVNLHLMLVSFYRPTRERHKILMEDYAFPSDAYAVRSQLRYHGYDPDEALVVARPRPGEATIRTSDLEQLLEARGREIALVLIAGVNYYSGQLFEIERITACARERGLVVGWDLAHAAGNVPLALHDWQVDFAVWCSYKYLNGGPGAVAGCFVHERHAARQDLPRLAGWWGNDPSTRFRMHLEPEFKPQAGADGWQLSNPPILSMAPLRSALALFDEAGMGALRAKSLKLGTYLRHWLEVAGGQRLELLTPGEPEARGCQLSIRAVDDPQGLFRSLEQAGVVADLRPPDVVRIAPVPMYNTFHEVWRFGQVLRAWCAAA